MNLLSAVIITYNEQAHIERCLASLQNIADDIVVVDSFSNDETANICSKYPVTFIRHPWEGYSGSKNFGNQAAKHHWIISLDADEALSESLRQSITAAKQHSSTLFYRCNLINNYCGKWIYHTGWFPDVKLRLFDRRLARWAGDIHEKLQINGQPQIGFLKGNMLHYAYSSIREHRLKNEQYALLMSQEMFRRGTSVSVVTILPRAVFTFIKFYLIRLGFLDGYAGFMISLITAQYTFRKYSLLRNLGKNSSLNKP